MQRDRDRAVERERCKEPEGKRKLSERERNGKRERAAETEIRETG